MGGKLADVLYCASLPDPISVVVTLAVDTEALRVIPGITLPFTYNCASCKVPCRIVQSIDSGSCIIHTTENGDQLRSISDVVLQLSSLDWGTGNRYCCSPECKTRHRLHMGRETALSTPKNIALYDVSNK